MATDNDRALPILLEGSYRRGDMLLQLSAKIEAKASILLALVVVELQLLAAEPPGKLHLLKVTSAFAASCTLAAMAVAIVPRAWKIVPSAKMSSQWESGVYGPHALLSDLLLASDYANAKNSKVLRIQRMCLLVALGPLVVSIVTGTIYFWHTRG